MLKKLSFAIILLLFISGCGKKTYPASRLYMPTGNFSYVTPEGWTRNKLPGINFLIVATSEDYGIKPNIFVDEIMPATPLDNAIEKISTQKNENLSNYEVKSKNDFRTQSELYGIKIEARHVNNRNLPLTTFQYLIQDADRIISITCTCAEVVKSKYEPLFDTAIKSLQSETAE
jgi:hypothetical protein